MLRMDPVLVREVVGQRVHRFAVASLQAGVYCARNELHFNRTYAVAGAAAGAAFGAFGALGVFAFFATLDLTVFFFGASLLSLLAFLTFTTFPALQDPLTRSGLFLKRVFAA